MNKWKQKLGCLDTTLQSLIVRTAYKPYKPPDYSLMVFTLVAFINPAIGFWIVKNEVADPKDPVLVVIAFVVVGIALSIIFGYLACLFGKAEEKINPSFLNPEPRGNLAGWIIWVGFLGATSLMSVPLHLPLGVLVWTLIAATVYSTLLVGRLAFYFHYLTVDRITRKQEMSIEVCKEHLNGLRTIFNVVGAFVFTLTALSILSIDKLVGLLFGSFVNEIVLAASIWVFGGLVVFILASAGFFLGPLADAHILIQKRMEKMWRRRSRQPTQQHDSFVSTETCHYL